MPVWIYISISILLIIGLYVLLLRLTNDYSVPTLDFFPDKKKRYNLVIVTETPIELLISIDTLNKYIKRKNVSTTLFEPESNNYAGEVLKLTVVKYNLNNINGKLRKVKSDLMVFLGNPKHSKLFSKIENEYSRTKSYGIVTPAISDKLENAYKFLNIKFSPNIATKVRIFSPNKIFCVMKFSPKISILQKLIFFFKTLFQSREYFYKIPK